MRHFPVVPAVLLVLAAILGASISPHFLDVRYLLDASTLYTETCLVALAMTFVIISGNIDLSVGSATVLTACLVALAMEKGIPPAAAIPMGVVLGTGMGLLNGWMVARLKLPSFLVTLGTMATFRGAAQATLGPASVSVPDGFKGVDRQLIAGLPVPLIVLVAMALVLGLVLHRTVSGRWVYAVGTNPLASRYAGVPVERVTIGVFALSGAMAGLAGVLMASRLGVARYNLAAGMELDAITMAVVGGTAIIGGKGTILGTLLASFLVILLRTGMGVANVKPEIQLIAIGALLAISVIATARFGKKV